MTAEQQNTFDLLSVSLSDLSDNIAYLRNSYKQTKELEYKVSLYERKIQILKDELASLEKELK